METLHTWAFLCLALSVVSLHLLTQVIPFREPLTVGPYSCGRKGLRHVARFQHCRSTNEMSAVPSNFPKVTQLLGSRGHSTSVLSPPTWAVTHVTQ